MYNLIDVDDEVRSTTLRKVSATKSGDASKGSSTEKRRVTLTLRATKVEYDGLSDCVRLSGTNTRQNDFVKVGAFHTMELGLKSQLTLTKACWDAVHRSTLFDAAGASKQQTSGELSALMIDSGKGRLYALSGATVRHVASVDSVLPKNTKSAFATAKLEKAELKFFEKLRDTLTERVDWSLARCVALAGSAVARAFYDWLKAEQPREAAELCKALKHGTLVVVSTASASVSVDALEPLLGDPTIAKLIADTALARHAKALESFRQAEVKNPDRVLYGSLTAALEAADRRAIDKLLVLDDRLKNPANVAQRRAFAKLVDLAKDAGADVLAFPTRHITAEKLGSLGGLALILRFPCCDLQHLNDAPAVSWSAVAAANPATPNEPHSTSAPHIETKRKSRVKPPHHKSAPATNSAANNTSKSRKPTLNYDDDGDYCDDDYHDY